MEKEKVESLYVTREMAEDKEMDEKIRQDLIHAADQAEKEFQKEALGAPRMKPEEKQQLFDDIVGELKKKGIWEESPEDQLSTEDREALRLGRELLNNPKKKRSAVIHKIFKGVAGAAVVAVGVFVLSMSSEANREKVLSVWNSVVKDELRIEIGDEPNSDKSSIEEQEASEMIKEQLDIDIPKFMYIPKGMIYSDYRVDKTVEKANIYYKYNDTIISICMYKTEMDGKRNQQFDGIVIDSVQINSKELKTEIWELDNGDNKSYMTKFECEDTCYMIWGEMSKDEFKKMVKSIIF